MYAPLAAEENVTVDTNAPALGRPAGIGDKQTVYLSVSNASGTPMILCLAGTGSVGFPVPDGEVWMLGPILGEDITKWGIFDPSGTAPNGVDVVFLEGDTKVDSGYNAPEFSPSPAVGLTWRQLA